MKNTVCFALWLAILLALSSCEKKTILSVDQSSVEISDTGGSQTVSLTANKPWTASSNQSWCKVSPSAGEEATNSRITITCDPNTTYDARNCMVTFTCAELTKTVSVSQATNNGLLVSQTEYNITNAAQQLEIKVQANVKFSVEVDNSCKDWVKYNTTKGLTTSTVVLDIAKNESYDNREGKVTIKQDSGNLSSTVVIKQEQLDGLFISNSDIVLTCENQQLNIEVSTNVEFEVSSDVNWITYIETKGLHTSCVVLSIAENEAFSQREGKVIVKQAHGTLSKNISVVQHGRGYYDGDVVLLSDQDISDFNDKDIIIIGGDLIIKNNGAIHEVNINNKLERVLGTIQIEGEASPISGFDNLNYAYSIKLVNNSCFRLFKNLSELPGEFYYCYLEPGIESFEGMEWLTKVGGNFSIVSPDNYQGMNSIVSFKGLDNLVSIGGSLNIVGFFSKLRSFDGLGGLKEVRGGFYVWGYGYSCFPCLTDFSGLESLEYIGGIFQIGCGMRNVKNFNGLNSLKYIGGDILFVDNWGIGSLLSSLSSFDGLENLEEIGGYLFRGGYLSGPVPIKSYSGLKSLKKLGGLLIQNLPTLDVDSFYDLDITAIGKYGVILNNDQISNLYFLRKIERIEGKLEAMGTSLRNWKGLSSLKYVGELYIGNVSGGSSISLCTADGLNSVESVGFLSVKGYRATEHIINLKGLENLKEIEHALLIEQTDIVSLDDLKSLSKIAVIPRGDNYIEVTNNTSLTKLSKLREPLQYLLDSKIYDSISQLERYCRISGNAYNPSVSQILAGNGDL